MNTKTLITGSVSALVLCALAGAETETAPTIHFDMSIGGASSLWTDSFGLAAEDSSLWYYAGGQSNSNGSLTYTLYADPDPILGFDFSFHNTTGSTQTFNVIVTLPVTAWANATMIGASIGASVTDANFDGSAFLSSVGGGDIFNGKIDGATWLPLFSAVNVGVPFNGGTSTISDVDGLPGPSNPGPFGVTTDIAITLTFDLTAGDRASFTGVFIVEYVPAPAGALAFAGLGFLGRRRRD